MSDQVRASSQWGRSWGLAEIGNPYGELTRFRPRALFISFEERLRISRHMYSESLPTIGGISHCHYNEDAETGYNYLCLRGFVVQCSLDPNDPFLADVFRFIDRLGWGYTVLHV